VYRIRVDRLREIARIVPGAAFFRISCAHEIAVLRDRALTFEHLDHHRSEIMNSTSGLKNATLAMHYATPSASARDRCFIFAATIFSPAFSET
jgi:hypothetical protein